MIVIITVGVIMYLIKIFIEYIGQRFGSVSIAPLRGCMIGFNIIEHPAKSEEGIPLVQVSADVALVFVNVMFMWYEQIETDVY